MADREVTDNKGNGFRLRSFVWRSAPSTSPLTGRSIRTIVGTDETGAFRIAQRTGRMGKDRFETVFAREAYASKESAIAASREMKVDFIRGEAENYLQANTQNANQIFRVDSIEGWRTRTPPGKDGARKFFEEFRTQTPSREKSPARARGRSIDR